MGQFQISTHAGDEPAFVNAANWLVALGMGLDRLGAVTSIDRLACEVLPNGKVIARDVRTGAGFVVQPCGDEGAAVDTVDDLFASSVSLEAMAADDDDEGLVFGELPPDDEGTEELLLDETEEVLRTALASPSGRAPIALQTILDVIAASQDENEAWRVALGGAKNVIACDSGAGFVRESSGTLRFVCAHGPSASQVVGARMPAGKGIVGFCVERQMSLIILDAKKDPRFCDRIDRQTGYDTDNVLAVPVRCMDHVFGCLELLNAPVVFSRKDMERLVCIADALGRWLHSHR